MATVSGAIMVSKCDMGMDKDLGIHKGNIACAGGYFELLIKTYTIGVFLFILLVISQLSRSQSAYNAKYPKSYILLYANLPSSELQIPNSPDSKMRLHTWLLHYDNRCNKHVPKRRWSVLAFFHQLMVYPHCWY